MKLKSIVLVPVFLAALAVSCQYPIFFALLTLVTSFLVFSKIEADQNVYDLGFWFTKYPSAGLLAWFRAFGKLEAIVRSILLGLLAWFTFTGKNEARILESTWLLCVAVFGSYLLLSLLVRKAHLNVLRWAFVKLSVILGVIFAILSVIFRTPRQSFLGLVGGWFKKKISGDDDTSIDMKVDQIHVVINDAVELIHEKLETMIGEPGASVILVLFNSQILQGFLVVLFTFVLLLMTVPELRHRPESKDR